MKDLSALLDRMTMTGHAYNVAAANAYRSPHLSDSFLDRVRKSYRSAMRDDAAKDSMWAEIG